MEQYKNLRAVVTGGAGFIGSHLVEKLLALGADVAIIDNFLYGSKIEHLRGQKKLTICEGDVRDTKVVSRVLKNKDVVFHLAACVGVEETQMSPLEVLDVEIQGTLNVLNQSVNNDIKRVILASSSEVYGDSLEPMEEDEPFFPKTTYALTKMVGEEYCRAFHKKYGTEYTCLRYFNIYGPRQDERFVIPRFVARLSSGKSIQIYGDGTQTRDFTYIDDAVVMTLLAGIKPEAKCQAINIGTGIMNTINAIAGLLLNIMDKKSIKPVYIDYDGKRPREIEILTRHANTTRATRLLQYQPKTDLRSGITKYITWCTGG